MRFASVADVKDHLSEYLRRARKRKEAFIITSTAGNGWRRPARRVPGSPWADRRARVRVQHLNGCFEEHMNGSP